jgi:hypothetical protein
MQPTVSGPVPTDHPLMQAWTAHKATEEYANSRRWAHHEEHVDGSLWALFMAGYMAAKACNCREGECKSDPAGCRMAAEVARRDPAAM